MYLSYEKKLDRSKQALEEQMMLEESVVPTYGSRHLEPMASFGRRQGMHKAELGSQPPRKVRVPSHRIQRPQGILVDLLTQEGQDSEFGAEQGSGAIGEGLVDLGVMGRPIKDLSGGGRPVYLWSFIDSLYPVEDEERVGTAIYMAQPDTYQDLEEPPRFIGVNHPQDRGGPSPMKPRERESIDASSSGVPIITPMELQGVQRRPSSIMIPPHEFIPENSSFPPSSATRNTSRRDSSLLPPTYRRKGLDPTLPRGDPWEVESWANTGTSRSTHSEMRSCSPGGAAGLAGP